MKKPLLVVVTGSPASGKSTLAHILADKVACPLISRDKLKEGLLNTLQTTHTQLDKPVDLLIYESFFETIDLLVSKGISLIAEAAFQDKLWRPKLLSLLDKADVKIVICASNPSLLKSRFANRLRINPDRERYHGDGSLHVRHEAFTALIENYQPVKMDVPTLEVDTSENYRPAVEEIVRFIR